MLGKMKAARAKETGDAVLGFEEILPSKAGMLTESFGSEWERHVHETAYKYTGSTVQIMRTMSLLRTRMHSAEPNDLEMQTATNHPSIVVANGKDVLKLPPIENPVPNALHKPRVSLRHKKAQGLPKIQVSSEAPMIFEDHSGNSSRKGTPDLPAVTLTLPYLSEPKVGRKKKIKPDTLFRHRATAASISGAVKQRSRCLGWSILRRKFYGGELKILLKKIKVS